MANDSNIKLYPHQEEFLKLLFTKSPAALLQQESRIHRNGMVTNRAVHLAPRIAPPGKAISYTDITKTLARYDPPIAAELIASVQRTMHEISERQLLQTFCGYQVHVVESWAWGMTWVYYPPLRRPTRKEGRRGTKRQWKRENPRGWRYRFGKTEPDHVIRSGDAVYCTKKQYELIKKGIMPL